MPLTRPRDNLKKKLDSLQAEILTILGKLEPQDILDFGYDDPDIGVCTDDEDNFIVEREIDTNVPRNGTTNYILSRWFCVIKSGDVEWSDNR